MAEIPEFKKCCFYIPLRHGLIIWGYISVILSLVILGLSIESLIDTLNFDYTYFHMYTAWSFVIPSIVSTVQLAFGILLIVAGHKTNTRLLNIYYKYGKYRIIVYVTVFVAVTILWNGADYRLTNYIESALGNVLGYLFIYNPALGLVDILLQAYFVLLLRSYLFTFDNNVQFKPLGDDTEAECTLEIVRNGQKEKIIKDVKIKISY